MVNGAEGIVIVDDSIVLGVQKTKRWYDYKNEKAALIKTIGGQIEKDDLNSTKKTVLRELFEEINNINDSDINISNKPIFNIEILFSKLNPFVDNCDMNMNADFYIINVNNLNIEPNDLPFLLKIPIKDFIKYKMGKIYKIRNFKKYIIKGKSMEYPSYFVFFVPNEVIDYLKDNY